MFAAARPHFRTKTGDIGPLLSVAANERLAGTSRAGIAPLVSGTASPAGAVAPRLVWFTTPDARPSARLGEAGNSVGLQVEDRNWLAIRFGPSATGSCFSCRAESELGASTTRLVNESKQIPDYFGVGVELAGKRLTWFAPDLRVWQDSYSFSKGAGQVKKEYLD